MATYPASVMSDIQGLVRAQRTRGYSIITATSNLMHNTQYTAGDTTRTYRKRHWAMDQAYDLRAMFGNWFAGGTGETPGSNPIQIKACLERANAQTPTDQTTKRIPLWFNGSRTPTLDGNMPIISDPAPFGVAKNELFFSRVKFVVNGGEKVPQGDYLMPTSFPGNGEGYAIGNTDAVDTGTVNTGANDAVCYSPICILGFVPGRILPSIGCIGDSILTGTGYANVDQLLGYENNPNNCGMLNIALNGRFPMVKVATGSEHLASFYDEFTSAQRMFATFYATDIVCMYGTNDLGVLTLAQLKAEALAVAQRFINRGQRFHLCTLLPRTNSTDVWVTTTNQTRLGFESDRTGFNDWVIDTSNSGFVAQAGGSYWASIFDTASAVEVDASGAFVHNGGFWRPNRTGDGTHPNTQAHIDCAAKIPTSVFTYV